MSPPLVLVFWLSSSIRNLLRREKADFFTLADFEAEEEPVVSEVDLGVLQGVLSLEADFGMPMALVLLVDWGVLCLPALQGVQWLLERVAMKFLLTPLCLDVLLQVWHVVTIADEEPLNLRKISI